MGTVLRIDGWRVMILTNDHPPPHVHILGGAGRAKIELDCETGLANLVWHDGISRPDLRRILAAIESVMTRLCHEWRMIHG